MRTMPTSASLESVPPTEQHAEIPLTGGESTPGVVRVGNTVRRPIGADAAYVHAVLRHLEAAGFTGAPRFLGVDARGREVLEYLDGMVPDGTFVMTDEQLVAAGRLLRAFHDATAGSAVAADADVVCHTDLGPHNTVFVDGLPAALIDWDGVRPGRRLDDLADAIWGYAHVGEEGGAVDDQRRRIAILCDAYGFADYAAVVVELGAQFRRALGNHERAGRTAAMAVFRPWVQWIAAHERELSGGDL